MKKFFAMLLSLVMIMSLSIPAFAAEITSTEEGSNTASKDVTATYTPSGTEDTTATITGVSITVDGTTYTNSTTDNPVVITPTSEVTITVTGTNFANATADNYVFYAWGTTMALNVSSVTVDTEATPNTASFYPNGTEFSSLTEAFEIQYTNDSENLTGTGIYVIYDSGLSGDELPTVTGVELTGGYASYDETSKTYTITPTSGDVTIKITGTNFTNLSAANMLYIPGSGWTLFNERWSIDTANNIATITLSNSDFSTLTTVQQFQFDAGEEDVSLGVYLIYQSETVSVDITWGAMSFTYDDTIAEGKTEETGWTCAEGANKITVANSGTVAVNAAVAYTPADGYSAITGKFQDVNEAEVTNADISAGGSYDFYLILSGKPEAAITARTTIGSVTVTITEAATSVIPTPGEDVSTPDEGSEGVF